MLVFVVEKHASGIVVKVDEGEAKMLPLSRL